jgi:hypothetical protein
MDKRPTAIENGSSEIFGNIDRPQVGRAQGRDEEDELQVRHAGIVDLKRLHSVSIIDRDHNKVNELRLRLEDSILIEGSGSSWSPSR